MKLIYTKAVAKDVKKIKDKRLIDQIAMVINNMKNITEISQLKSIKKLSGNPNAYRVRIGNYRLGFYYEKETIVLGRFLKRNDIYKVFPE